MPGQRSRKGQHLCRCPICIEQNIDRYRAGYDAGYRAGRSLARARAGQLAEQSQLDLPLYTVRPARTLITQGLWFHGR